MQWPSDATEEIRRKPICGVMAVAIVAGVSFAEATEAVKRHLPSHRVRHGGRTWPEQLISALGEFGINISTYKLDKRMSFKRWMADVAEPGRTYIVKTGQHFVTVRDGVLADQYQIAPLAAHGASRLFVVQVIEVI